MWFFYSNLVGYIGVGIILVAFYCSQINAVNHEHLTYSSSNLIGSLCLLFSLYFHPNSPSIVIEIAWLGISLIGMVRIYRQRLKKSREEKAKP